MSFRRKPESSNSKDFWTPAFAGVTELRLFTKPSNIGVEKIERMIDFISGKIWYSSTVTEGVIKSGLGNSVIFREITTL